MDRVTPRCLPGSASRRGHSMRTCFTERKEPHLRQTGLSAPKIRCEEGLGQNETGRHYPYVYFFNMCNERPVSPHLTIQYHLSRLSDACKRKLGISTGEVQRQETAVCNNCTKARNRTICTSCADLGARDGLKSSNPTST